MRFIPVIMTNPDTKETTTVNAILDGGATLSMASRNLMDVLGLHGKITNLMIGGITGTKSAVESVETNVIIMSLSGDIQLEHKINMIKSPVGEIFPMNLSLIHI